MRCCSNVCRSAFSSLLLMLLFMVSQVKHCGCHVDVKCWEMERKALVAMRAGFTDPSGRLSSWDEYEQLDCCNWTGVHCDSKSGHVIKLNLHNYFQFNDSDITISKVEMIAYERSNLGGQISYSLLHLKFLKYLDLSFNNFEMNPSIPHFFGELKNLRYLDLSYSSFSGIIPPSLGNLSKLQYLDLSENILRVEKLHWISGLSSLKYLNLAYVDLTSVGKDWVQVVSMLPSLLELHLPSCYLQGESLPHGSHSWLNFTSILVLDMSFNDLNSSLPLWLFNLTSLTKLDLSHNSFRGPISPQFTNLANLEYLDFSGNNYLDGQLPRVSQCELKYSDLSGNKFSGGIKEFLSDFSLCPNNSLLSLQLSHNELVGELPESLGLLDNLQFLDLSVNLFWGSIPASIGNLSFLKELQLFDNQMNGSIPESFGQLSELTSAHLSANYLDDMNIDTPLEANSWEGVITESHLMNLTKMENLALATTTQVSKFRPLVFKVPYEWVPSFRLKTLSLKYCLVGPLFPVWLQVQSSLTSVTITNAGISDTIPEEWFSKLAFQLEYLDLSYNQIKGKLPHQLELPNERLYTIDLRHNLIEGSFPLWSTNATLQLDSNSFSGPIPQDIGDLMPMLKELQLSENNFNGTIPLSICKLMDLEVLSLRKNQFSGELPGCWSNSQSLMIIDISSNSLCGSIPASLGSLHGLIILALSDNNLEGQIPSSLHKCTDLETVDLGGNRLSGNMPLWIGEQVLDIHILRLRENLLGGDIPHQLCRLHNLHLLDLSQNKFSGVIPKCLGNLSALVCGNNSFNTSENANGELHMVVVAKGTNLEYSNTIVLVNSIDLSENYLTGGIPEEIVSISGLSILNLSRNQLNGRIPGEIGKLRLLETFDLSHNNLWGPIPPSLSSLAFLSHLNLSFNNLVGRIPSGYQLQTLNESSIYEGNPSLCGVPLQSKCPGDDAPTPDGVKQDKKGKDGSDIIWLDAGIGFGFVIGFCVSCGIFLSRIMWGHAYIRSLDRMTDRIALALASKFRN